MKACVILLFFLYFFDNYLDFFIVKKSVDINGLLENVNYMMTSPLRIFVWNPDCGERGSEIVCEFPSYNQWSFNLDWCKRDPSLVATSSVDGTVSVYSILGGGLPPTQADKVS